MRLCGLVAKTLGLQVYKQYLLWGLMSIKAIYFGLFGVLGKGANKDLKET